MNVSLAPVAVAFAAALALASAGGAHAQGTITSGTATLSFTGTPFGTGTGNANLLFGGSFATDQLFRLGWSYNQGTGTSNRPFSALDTPVASYAGNVATFTWTNAGAGASGFARFDATLTVRLTEAAPAPGSGVAGAARVDSLLSFTAAANNAGPIAYALFHDLDFDIQGTSGPGGDTYRVLDGAVFGRAFDVSSLNYAECLGIGANRYELNTGAALRTRVGAGGTGTGNLSTPAGVLVADWASTDGAVAFQWNRTLAPGETAFVQSAFSINTLLIPEPASALLMLAGVAAMGGAAARRVRR